MRVFGNGSLNTYFLRRGLLYIKRGVRKCPVVLGVAVLIVFCGCGSSGGGGGGGDDGNVDVDDGGTEYPGIAADMTEDGLLLLEGGDTVWNEEFDGHGIEVSVSGCSRGVSINSCRIDIINRSSDHYLANARITTDHSSNPAVAFANADFQDSVPLHGTTMDPSGGVPAPVDGAGFCVVEDGDYQADAPYNAGGCAVSENPHGTYKPYQTLPPDCGRLSRMRWDFQNTGQAGFSFSMQIAGQWFPENPYGPDFVAGTSDDDPRFNFQDRLTYLVMVTDLEDVMSATNKEWYRLGSYRRSNVLSGWSAIDSGYGKNNAVLEKGRYFAVNVAAEYPDRIESRSMGDKSNFTDYEYYRQFSYILRYNPDAVERVSTGGRVRGGSGGTYLEAGALDVCSTGDCGPGLETYRGYEGPDGLFSSFNDQAGYIMTYAPLVSNAFSWMPAGDAYSTVSGKSVSAFYGTNVPLHMGHHGVARVNMTPVHTYTGYSDYILYSDSAVVQEGVDNAPDMPLAMYYFKVSGDTGSEFRIDMFAGYSVPHLATTNHTLTPSGWAPGSDDWLDYCLPMSAGYDNNEYQGCDPAKSSSDYTIHTGAEISNPDITHSGQSIPAGGAYQSWNAHICIQ